MGGLSLRVTEGANQRRLIHLMATGWQKIIKKFSDLDVLSIVVGIFFGMIVFAVVTPKEWNWVSFILGVIFGLAVYWAGLMILTAKALEDAKS